MEPVGVGRRALAVIIDSILLFIVGYLLAVVMGGATETGFNLQGGPFFVWILIALGYYIVMEKVSGATLGKMAMGLRVVKDSGEPLDWQASVIRNLLRLIDSQLVYLIAAITVWVTKKNQRLGDLAAHTLVVRAKTWLPIAFVSLMAAFVPGDANAAPKYGDIVVSDAATGTQKNSFRPTTSKIYIRANVDAPAGTKLRCDWIAEKTKVVEPNFKIDSTELVTKAGMNKVSFTFSKPDAGWPEGDYRADLFIDGKPAEKVRFKVVK